MNADQWPVITSVIIFSRMFGIVFQKDSKCAVPGLAWNKEGEYLKSNGHAGLGPYCIYSYRYSCHAQDVMTYIMRYLYDLFALHPVFSPHSQYPYCIGGQSIRCLKLVGPDKTSFALISYFAEL